jgi:hypothetical protein
VHTLNDNEKGVQSENRFDTPFPFIIDSYNFKLGANSLGPRDKRISMVYKHTNISSTNQGHGLCYYFFIVEVKEGQSAYGTMLESVFKTGQLHTLV